MKLCLRCNQYFEDSVERCPTDQAVLENVGKDPLIGALINNRYLVDSVIGKGSSGIVYRATRLGRGGMVVAIKVLHSFIGAAGSALDRFLREVQAASSLKNPHIIRIWEWGVTDDSQPYFVMDYLEGITLGRLIREKGQIEPKRVLPIMRQTCNALVEAHRLGITHRDLKPENIILQVSTGADYVKLLDFGIADSPQHAMLAYKFEKPRTVSGSPAYMSPEQCQGFELDGRSDIYSLAIVVFEMLTGTRPFHQSEDVNVMVLHVSEPPMALSEARPDLNFPPAIENVLARALSKQPADRQPTIQDFILDLENAWQYFDQQPIAVEAANPAVKTLNKLQGVATSVTTPVQKSGVSSGTVETEIARANSYAANQPSVLGPPPARMSSTHNNLKAQDNLEKLTRDPDSETSDEQVIQGTTTVQRLMKAVQSGKLASKSKNQIASIKNQFVSENKDTAEMNQNILQAQTALEHAGTENSSLENAKDLYIKQRKTNTLSRLEGWKKSDKTRIAIVTTRAKAAAIKGEKASKPIDIWNLLMVLTTLLCLGTSIYIIYTALKTELPHPISTVQNLARIGRYDSVKLILENRQLTARLSPAERDELGLAYLNLAKSSIANHDTDGALVLLARIDPQSPSAAQGRKLRDKLLKAARIRQSF